jgi:hypothetical protein
MAIYNFVVRGDYTRARDTVYAILERLGFKLTLNSDWTAVAERGSSVLSFLLWLLTPPVLRHVKLYVAFATDKQGHLQITLTEGADGKTGGTIGVIQVADIYSTVYGFIREEFRRAGVLISDGYPADNRLGAS